MTFDGTRLKVFVDGVQTSSTNSYESGTRVFDRVCIGCYIGAWDYFDGSIDDVKIWKRALSAEEINASFQAGISRLQTNFTNLTDGNYTYKAYAVDQAGNMNETETRSITIDTTPPLIKTSLNKS